MHLHYAPASPYVRKVLLAAAGAGVLDRIELVRAHLSPIEESSRVCADNPLGKIPTLVLDDGSTLFDSRVIVAYLDTIGSTPLQPPPSDPAYWRLHRLQATADGLLDAALAIRYERLLRPEVYRWDEWIAGQGRKIDRAVTALEAEANFVESGPPLAAICVASALGYLDFRFAERDWRSVAPRLAAFFSAYSCRPEMIATLPPPA